MEYKIDCKGKYLGRVASEIAVILQGKKSAKYDPRLEGDDSVIIENVDDLKLSGNKKDQKIYYSHTTQIGHLKERSFKNVVEKHGMQYILTKAVKNMIPKNRLQSLRMKKIKFQ